MKLYARGKNNNGGQAVIEFVAVIGVLVFLLYGVVDLVQMGITKHVLDSACREGVRVAIAIPHVRFDDAVVKSRVKRVMQDSKLEALPEPEITFYSPEGDLLIGRESAEYGDIIKVTVAMPYANVFSLSTQTAITLRGEAIMKYFIVGL